MITTMELLNPVHSSYALRASFSGYDQPNAKIHAFDGVRGACGRRPESSAWAHAALMFHPSATYPTCRGCRNRGRYPARYASPELQHQAIGRLVTYALASHDPGVLTTALRLLCAPPTLGPIAALLSGAADATEAAT